MKKNDRKPEIRFSGFETAWQKKCFGDEFNILSNNTLSRDFLNYDQGIAKNVHYGDVLIKFNEYLDASKEVLPYIEDERVIDKFQNSFLRDGDIVIADTAEDETVGKCTEIGHIRDLPIIAGLHTMPCRPKGKYAPMYLGYYLNANAYHRELLPLMQGVKVTSISRSGVKDTDIIVSEEYDEQKKIGQYLFTLDEKIKFEKDKLDRLIILKKAMLEKMFPQGNSKVPEIRFEKYTDEWEQRKLGNIIDLRSGRDYKHLSAGEIPVYGTGGYMLSVNEALSYKEDAIGIGRKGTIDKPYILKAPFWTVDTLFYALPETNNDLDFIFDIFQNINWKQRDESTGVPSLSKTAINEIDVLIPEYKEQKQIGCFFQNIDYLITLHQRKPIQKTGGTINVRRC